MAKAWTKGAWNEELHRIAREAAKSRMEKRDLTGYSQEKINAIQRELERTAKEKLDKEFSFDKIKDTEKDYLTNWKGVEAGNYLLGGGNEAYRNSFNPLVRKKMDDFAKLGPLVLGLADEGRDWYSMGSEDLFAKGEELGYDTKSKKGKMDFLRDVGDVQQAHDRGKMLEEFNRENSVLSDLFYPTLMEEARKQITTGRGTQKQLDDAKKLDLIMNGVIGVAPILGDLGISGKAVQTAAAARDSKAMQALARSPLFKPAEFLDNSPVISATIGAAAQGAAEAERQRLKEKIDPELEANYANALLALTTGATRPGMIGTAAALSQQVPGRAMSRFSRGVSGATRRGNPTNAERDEFANALEMLMGRQKKAVTPTRKTLKGKTETLNEGNLADQQAINILSGENAATYTLPEIANARLAEKAIPQLEALYGPEKAKRILDNALKKEQVLNDYDELANLLINRDKYNAARQLPVGKELVNGELREGDVLTKLEQAFPSKMAEAYGNDKFYKAGLRTGEILGTLGGSIEPMIKVNPLGPLSGGRLNIVDTDYKQTKWYKSLSKKQQEAFDDAYEKSKKASE